jgi:2',3'-cyclic-nucleotide 2'-phosphodiesterase (5'-nucleotidase family)
MRIRIALYFFCVLAVAPAYANAQQDQASASKTITILQLNDVYQIAPVDRGKRGGLARIGTLQKKIRAGAPNTLFLLSGDFISPSVASRLFKGKQMIAALNSAGLDIATLGNHEFDFGPAVLRERMKESRFAYTIANVSDTVGSRVTGIEVAGRPMEPERSYTIAVNAYILGGGDGYDFKGGEVLITPENGPVEPDVVMEAIKNLGTIAPQVEGRIKSAQANHKSTLLPFRRSASTALLGVSRVSAR